MVQGRQICDAVNISSRINELISLGCFIMVKSAEKRSTWEEGGENAEDEDCEVRGIPGE